MKRILMIALLGWMGVNAASDSERLPGPIFEELGTLRFPVTTRSAQAQRYFDQGVAFLYGFNHQEAIRSFRSAALLDPQCAMAHWGVAYASGPHVNRPMSAEDTQRAWDALQSAQAHQAAVTPREQAYIQALATRYQQGHTEDRSALDQAFAGAMRGVVTKYPDDVDARVMLAESLMNLMPWNYWQPDGTPKPEMVEAFDVLRWVLKREPQNPGANHFYIHAVEAGPNPELGLPSADRLLRFAPDAGHLVHMPAHIYLRVGQYDDAVVANELAVKADESYFRRVRAQGFYPGVYYPHNLHFLWQAQLLDGRSRAAGRTAEKSARFAVDNYCGPRKALEAPRLRHLPWLTAWRFGRWDDVLKIPQPAGTNDFLVDRAVWHFVRGQVFAGRGALADAEREHQQMKQRIQEGAAGLDSPAFPVSATLNVAELWLAGKVAAARGDWAESVNRLQQAVAAEDALPYMEPAFWPIPVRPALGVALLKSGKPGEAEQVFRADLEKLPRNGWGLLGLQESLRQQNRPESAELVRQQFEEAWRRSDVVLSVEWF